MFKYLFQSKNVFSKDYGRKVWIIANNNLEAQELCNGFDWSSMSRYLNK